MVNVGCMKSEFIRSPRYKTPNFREKHMRNVTVDSEGRVFLFNKEASPLTIDERFHFFQEVLDPDDWERFEHSTICQRLGGGRISRAACGVTRAI